MFYSSMSDRPASWRMPTPKQMDRMAAAVGRKAPAAPEQAPSDDMPPEYWQALLAGARADETYLPGRQPECQSAFDWDPLSASKRDPFDRRALLVALGSSELVGVAETARARVV